MTEPRQYQLIIFDFDGTLADTFDWFVGAINVAAARHGFTPLDLARLDEYRGLSGRELIARVGMPFWKVPAVATSMRRSMAETIASIRLFDGVLDLLHALRERGVTIAVVSSNTRANIERVLGPDGVALISHFACGASIFGKKPLIRRIVKASGISDRRVLCIGDETRDADAAAALGIDFVGVAWGYATPHVLAPRSARALFTKLEDILDVA